jgi:FlaG/FlaF family flagellin (archaellin)
MRSTPSATSDDAGVGAGSVVVVVATEVVVVVWSAVPPSSSFPQPAATTPARTSAGMTVRWRLTSCIVGTLMTRTD